MTEKRKLTDEDDALLAELGIEIEFNDVGSRTAREERIIAGFEEIQKFVELNERLPEHGENKDIFERIYAVRLDQIRSQQECVKVLGDLDYQNLLGSLCESANNVPDEINDDELLAQLGVDDDEEDSITKLKHIRSRAEKKAAEEIANRTRCENFEQFKLRFEAIKKDIERGFRKTIRFRKDAGFAKTVLKQGQFIIVGGQIAYIASIGEIFKAPNGDYDARLRVIYDNGTESNILMRSVFRAMYKDETSRFITDSDDGPLFSGHSNVDDIDSGTIYVLRSFSEHPLVKANRAIVHKIGVTGGDVKARVANAKYDPTFLMAEVEIAATYKLANISRIKLEKLIHNFFSSAKFDIELKDRFGKTVKANEWFLVPLFVIDEMVEKIKTGTVGEYYYDLSSASIVQY